jgi:hypothetical protein
MRLAKVEAETRGALKDQKSTVDLAALSCLERETSQELRRLLPELLWISRAWHARFLVKGCLACHRKKAYGSGGMCQVCVNANRDWIRKYVKQATANRDTVEEIAGLSRSVDAAQLAWNTDDREFGQFQTQLRR